MRNCLVLFLSIFSFPLFSQFNEITKEFELDLDSSHIIGFCECIHGSARITENQLALVDLVNNKNELESIFIEYNNLYVSSLEFSSKIRKINANLSIIGYNPGSLYASFQYAKKHLQYSNTFLLSNLIDIFDQLDSNEGYYWYHLNEAKYDVLQFRLDSAYSFCVNRRDSSIVSQLKYDLRYLSRLHLTGSDLDRDSLMFDYILRNSSNNSSRKILIFGHCGHLFKQLQTRERNLGNLLHQKFGNKFLLIGTDAQRIELVNKDLIYEKHKKKIQLDRSHGFSELIHSNFIKKKSQKVFLIGSHFNLNEIYRISYFQNMNWLLYYEELKIMIK